ncbi:MAG: DUF1365 domain-containing protein, partial [Limnobacter sp.]|nr:DUF1365 domain-containing protein [Limnobacter sp.]
RLMNLKSCLHIQSIKLAWGKVRHHRQHPKPNGFTTGVCFVRVRFTDNPNAPRYNGRYPAIDKPGLFSLHGTNYGFEKHSQTLPELAQSLRATMAQETGQKLEGAVELHTFPKVLGFVFNPVSFWYFYDKSDQCTAILCEVNNTFGERHFYCLSQTDQTPLNKGQEILSRKLFHVSPFFPVSGEYRFRFMDHENRSLAKIDYHDQDALQLTTSVSGTLESPNGGKWAQTLLRFGWSTVVVVFKIHWQALKLWTKGAKFHRKPAPPDQSVTKANVLP